MTFAAEVRRHRTALGLTLEGLAERSGLSPHYLSTLENGHRDPRLSTVLALAKALRVAPSALITGAPDGGDPKLAALFERAPREAQDAVRTLLRLAVARTRDQRAPRPRGR